MLRSSLSRKQFPSYGEAHLLLCIRHTQSGILKQGCLVWVSRQNESGMLLLNDQSEKQRHGASSKSCFLTLALLTLGAGQFCGGGHPGHCTLVSCSLASACHMPVTSPSPTSHVNQKYLQTLSNVLWGHTIACG